MKIRKYSVVYNDEIYDFLVKNSGEYTIKQLVEILKTKYNFEIERKKLAQYCIKMGIKYKYEKPNKSHSNKATPNGTIVNKTDGNMLKIKVGEHKWEYLQRIIYEKHYNIKLKENEYIMFLDQNRRNFNINNLQLVTRQESATISATRLYSTNPMVTKTGIQVVKLMNKAKEIENETNYN